MSDSKTVEITSIRGLEVTEDGRYLLVRGEGNTAALHHTTFNDLLVALPNAIERSVERLNQARGVGYALHCVGWEIGLADGTTNLIMRFRLSDNAGLSFSVPFVQVPDLLTALQAVAGRMGTPPQNSNVTLQ